MSDLTLRVPDALLARRRRTDERLEDLAAGFESFELRDERYPTLTIYATGSLGRGEIGQHSDLDVFLVDTASASDTSPLGRIEQIKLLRDLIMVAENAGFRAFSRDGAYLVVHPLSELLEALGTPWDDYSNVFTARLLLLLESRPLLGDAAYRTAIEHVLDLYWRDCDDPDDFLPTFLANDIVRYWKTLCLSYEGHRHAASKSLADPEQRVKLLKLKFNRVWMCFNGLAYVLHLFAESGTLQRAHVDRLVSLTPIERMQEIAGSRADATPLVQTLLDDYAWFLEAMGGDRGTTADFVADDDNYREARSRGVAFGNAMGDLVERISADTAMQRYLLI